MYDSTLEVVRQKKKKCFVVSYRCEWFEKHFYHLTLIFQGWQNQADGNKCELYYELIFL